jgi:hypothetical protein
MTTSRRVPAMVAVPTGLHRWTDRQPGQCSETPRTRLAVEVRIRRVVMLVALSLSVDGRFA